MTLTPEQEVILRHLRAAYAGPEGGENEVIPNPPNRQYAVGMLHPRPATEDDTGHGEDHSQDLEALTSAVAMGDVEESDATVPLAEPWRPSSVAISFVTDAQQVSCDFSGATYEEIKEDGPPRWRRVPFREDSILLAPDRRVNERMVGGVRVEIGSRWRAYGESWLVTVHARVLAESTSDDRLDVTQTLYQVSLSVAPADGASILEYDTRRSLDLDPESAELRLRFRDTKVYAVGHGMAADWEIEEGRCTRVFLDPVPHRIVTAIDPTGFEPGTAQAKSLELDHLATLDSDRESVLSTLHAFVDAFATWVTEQESRVASFGDDAKVAERIVARSRQAHARMRSTLDLLADDGQVHLRTAFSLAMKAMALQMRQAAKLRGDENPAPAWRPFQLGFLLVAIPSTVDAGHPDRELVDLIWFPTGGGKTEAYLALAAIEIFHRRLTLGVAGGGTAVITRYTLRLLTAQQFQRAAALICAMELLRRSSGLADPRVRGMAKFSIGLWVGNEATPGTRREAKAALDRLEKAARPEEANPFQVESCPWCDARLIPERRSSRRSDYGFRLEGRDLVIHCVDPGCEFSEELPVRVVDEMLYDDPPTILLATVDKFARLQFRPDAGKLLGLQTSFRQPSLIIQDELHLLSGPLGTTVAVFDAVIQILLSAHGVRPKIVASTATIRSSAEQVKGLYGRDVALYPPSGLDHDKNFFSQPDASGTGRLYVGLMPQSLSQMSATVAAAAPLIELPQVLDLDPTARAGKDAYWTAVLYHNSLRELGRTGTLVVDDVNARLGPRAERLGIPLRTVRAGRVIELTSRRGPEELPNDLRDLRRSIEETPEAVDVVLSSNMLSVGIDISRLALMLMVGQPKTTSEYIQATSRVGRGSIRGVVVTLFRSNRARDRSYFETFRSYHEALYRSVEPTSVTPWSLASRERSLAGALVTLVRHLVPGMAENGAAGELRLDNPTHDRMVTSLVEQLLALVTRSDRDEVDETREDLWRLLRVWDRRARATQDAGKRLVYDGSGEDTESLLKRFGLPGEGWVVGDSMRSVEPNVAVEVMEPNEGRNSGADQA